MMHLVVAPISSCRIYFTATGVPEQTWVAGESPILYYSRVLTHSTGVLMSRVAVASWYSEVKERLG
jgi:hypothetical protein